MESFTKIDNIVEICIALDIAILGIAYPIIVDKISTIGDKYGSLYISNVFESTWPQRKVGKREFKISLFRLIVYFTLSTFFFQVFQFKPWFKLEDWLAYLNNPNNFMLRGLRPLVLSFDFSPYFGWKHWFWMLENSADLLVFIASGLLIVSFFIWLNKVALFSGKSTSLLTELTNMYSRSKEDSDLRRYCLKSINELTYYAVEKQDEHLEKTIIRFYSGVFLEYQRRHDRSEPLRYDFDLYDVIYKLHILFVNTKNIKLPSLEEYVVSGKWLLGDGIPNPISEETYRSMWMNLCVISENERLIRLFWANSNLYFSRSLGVVSENYENLKLTNNDEIDKRNKERSRFKELHYALGGLLLYRRQNKAINYIFTYSRFHPSKYFLLPYSMREVFELFDFFSNTYSNTEQPLDAKYSFPELDNLAISGKVIDFISSYITLLFIRQYMLEEHFRNKSYIILYNLPEEISDLYRWSENISYFKKCLNDIINNKELLKDVGFDKMLKQEKFQEDNSEVGDGYKKVKIKTFDDFLEELKDKVWDKIRAKRKSAEISEDKEKAFENDSKKEIDKVFKKYDSLFNKTNSEETNDGDLKIYIDGIRNFSPRIDFTEYGTSSVLTATLATYKIRKGIVDSFLVAKTKSYLLHKDNLNVGLERIIGAAKDVLVLGFNVGDNNKKKLKGFNVQFYEITHFENVLFILRRSDLPIIEYKDLEEDIITQQQLKPLNEDLNTYYSIIDIENSKNEQVEGSVDEEYRVQISISFLWEIIWKRDRSVVQVNIMSPYYEQGIETELNNIEPL
ncbi:hypothetical protein [Runella zeae]|uniref:hypothetical protein n=1 Tax=Runella zeae TaxID=94255 RepID=UPI000409F31F|nr:hypothetical protein [Runella zeae]